MKNGKIVNSFEEAIRDISVGETIIVGEHVNKHGESKVKKQCTPPLTGRQVVHRLITDLAVFDFTPEGMILAETQVGVTVEEVKANTEASFHISSELVVRK